MAYTYDELKHTTVKELREIARDLEHEAVQGYSQMRKEQLIEALCTALNIDMYVHHEAVLENKTQIKQEIRRLKKQRDDAIENKDKKRLKKIRRRIHRLKRTLRKATA